MEFIRAANSENSGGDKSFPFVTKLMKFIINENDVIDLYSLV